MGDLLNNYNLFKSLDAKIYL